MRGVIWYPVEPPQLLLRQELTPPPIRIACGQDGCRYEASALTEGRALRNWAAHRVAKHRKEQA